MAQLNLTVVAPNVWAMFWVCLVQTCQAVGGDYAVDGIGAGCSAVGFLIGSRMSLKMNPLSKVFLVLF